MTRSSPGVGRVVAILNFFADHPGQAFTLTDLVRALRLSRATCHALLAGLVEAGYLYRASDKSYVIGPALAAVGRAASASTSPLQIAQPEMRALADRYAGSCSAVFRDGNDVVIRERASAASHVGFSVTRGTRLPLRPPFAAIFFAWSAPTAADAWLAQLTPPPSPERRAQMAAVMAFAREHGFCLGVRNLPAEPIGGDTEWLFNDEFARHPVLAQIELDDDAEYRPSSLNAPVFDADGNVAFVLALIHDGDPVSGREVRRRGGEVRDACRRISRFLAGRVPEAAEQGGASRCG